MESSSASSSSNISPVITSSVSSPQVNCPEFYDFDERKNEAGQDQPPRCRTTTETTVASAVSRRSSNNIDHQEPIDVVSGIATKLQARKIGDKYLWIPSLGLSSPLVSDPLVNLKNEQKYIIKITTNANCEVYDTLLVRVFNQYDIFVPKGFTPNNDGKNDRLFPFLVGIKSLNVFKIFDRWGNLIYNNSNVNSSTGWDGRLKGKLAPIGAYVWVAEGVDLDNNIIKRRGNFALIR